MAAESASLGEQQGPASERVTVRRAPDRGKYEPAEINAILDAGSIAHVGVSTEQGPIVLPMVYGRTDDTLYLHGSAANALLRSGKDTEVCVTVTLVDALVLARSSFHHSINYRSVVVRGAARKIEGDEKMTALELITNHIVHRWDDSRKPNDKEMKATLVLGMPLTEASAKIRVGDPKDEEEDMTADWWSGLLPFEASWGAPTNAADLNPMQPVPDAVQAMQGKIARA